MRVVLIALGVLAAVLVAFLAFGMSVANSPDGQARIQERADIDRCREAENDPLSELETRRMMRTECDRMARDYVAKWGREP